MAPDRSRERSERRLRTWNVSEVVVRRLSLYLRELQRYAQAGCATVRSTQLAQTLGLTDSQVRKDLAYFGQFGYRGRGYVCTELIDALRRILGTEQTWPVAVVGMGNLGRALLGYRGFAQQGFRIAAGFDIDSRRLMPPVDGVELHLVDAMPDVVRRLGIRLAMLAVPADAAQAVAEQCVQAGIEGILNFAPVALSLPPQIHVVRVDLAMELEQLSYAVVHRTGQDAAGRA
jgi:redox-sensing transcriptional repressor